MGTDNAAIAHAVVLLEKVALAKNKKTTRRAGAGKSRK
jgi:hypothetical protein